MICERKLNWLCVASIFGVPVAATAVTVSFTILAPVPLWQYLGGIILIGNLAVAAIGAGLGVLFLPDTRLGLRILLAVAYAVLASVGYLAVSLYAIAMHFG